MTPSPPRDRGRDQPATSTNTRQASHAIRAETRTSAPRAARTPLRPPCTQSAVSIAPAPRRSRSVASFISAAGTPSAVGPPPAARRTPAPPQPPAGPAPRPRQPANPLAPNGTAFSRPASACVRHRPRTLSWRACCGHRARRGSHSRTRDSYACRRARCRRRPPRNEAARGGPVPTLVDAPFSVRRVCTLLRCIFTHAPPPLVLRTPATPVRHAPASSCSAVTELPSLTDARVGSGAPTPFQKQSSEMRTHPPSPMLSSPAQRRSTGT